jgi:putative aldouronate transport system permease protein
VDLYFPQLANDFHIIFIRTFFQELPGSLTESAKIDGAGEFRIFFRIVLPLSKPVMATIALLTLLVKWNDWYTSLIYIRDAELYTLQYMLQRILREAEFINKISRNMPAGIDISQISGDMPTEGMRFAMCIVAAGPMLVVFPFFQKYFTRGLTIGAVKG